MALWMVNSAQDQGVYTIVYLLKDALRSALADAQFFERATCSRPDIKGAGHAEIAARLGRFRDACNSLQQREALMVTKLVRARAWAFELKALAPEFQAEIEQFLDATESCRAWQAEFVRDTQRMFNGGASLSRFLSRRKPEVSAEGESAANKAGSTSYLVGGETALFEVRVACEVFLGQIDTEFFGATADAAALSAPLAAYLDSLEEPHVSAPLALSVEDVTAGGAH